MSSKYAKLQGRLPAFQNEAPWQAKVDEWKKTHLGENPEDAGLLYLLGQLSGLKDTKDGYEEEIGKLNIAIEAVSQAIVSAMKVRDEESVRTSSGATCYLQYSVYPSIKDRDALLGWARAKKMAHMLTLPWQTLRSLCNELTLDGKPLPSGVECFLKTEVRIRKNGEQE